MTEQQRCQLRPGMSVMNGSARYSVMCQTEVGTVVAYAVPMVYANWYKSFNGIQIASFKQLHVPRQVLSNDELPPLTVVEIDPDHQWALGVRIQRITDDNAHEWEIVG